MPDLRWALTVPFSGVPLAAHGELFRRIEAAGYDDVWTSETAGYDGFTPLALAAAHTERLRLATGVVNPYTRGPAVLAQHCAALSDVSGGRFVLGLGSSSNVIVEKWNGVPFEKPLTRMREAIEGLRPVLAGDRSRALELVPDELAREVFLFGSASEQRERLDAFAEGGITTFVLTPVCEPPEVLRFVEAMAPARQA